MRILIDRSSALRDGVDRWSALSRVSPIRHGDARQLVAMGCG